eukprot:g3329.t1
MPGRPLLRVYISLVEVYFNAAGRVLATSRATLLHGKGSMLERWFGGDWTVQDSEKLGQAVRIDQDSETFASVLQILRFHRIFGPTALPAGYPCRKAKLPLLRQALSYFQLEQVKGTGKGAKGKNSASAWLSPRMHHREEVYEASSDTNSPVRWEVAVERRVVTRPASVPKLDLTQMQQLLEEEDYEEAEQEDEAKLTTSTSHRAPEACMTRVMTAEGHPASSAERSGQVAPRPGE